MIDQIKTSIKLDKNEQTQMWHSKRDMMFDREDELDLAKPYSKITCLILYLYSMELGSPPLYYEINRVSRSHDETHLATLGPYIMALGLVTSDSENRREDEDKI